MRPAVRDFFIALAGCWSINASAALVTMTGPCTANCSELGLNSGDAVSAQFNVNAGPGLTNLNLTKSNVVSFVIDFGNIDLTNANLPTED